MGQVCKDVEAVEAVEKRAQLLFMTPQIFSTARKDGPLAPLSFKIHHSILSTDYIFWFWHILGDETGLTRKAINDEGWRMSGLAGNTECIVLVLLEMSLSFFGIVSNLLIVTTLRNEETLRASTLNFLLFNLCFSNLVISFLVKPISAIYIGYAVSTGEAQVSSQTSHF